MEKSWSMPAVTALAILLLAAAAAAQQDPEPPQPVPEEAIPLEQLYVPQASATPARSTRRPSPPGRSRRPTSACAPATCG